MNILKSNGSEFIEFISIQEEELLSYHPLAGSFAVLKCDGKYLMCYNVWRKQWELPAGGRENNETPKECAIRELYEETGQIVTDLKFRGLLKTKKTEDEEIRYNPVYSSITSKLQPFIENNETSKIMLWDLKEIIGTIDMVDIKILEFI
ncbi:NUDIX hydrolase [Bacillus salacetis]|uniref:NUDIX hydrolase n=1 Tax=Bacillus salacetis TaxID=2315464 RepID=A0A3A1QQ21_9BACI|nr:NUDIX hydrolase [Bacillus salacetis]RIW28939.1 NUDIX hydrolase [Bacillus salacetis]